MEDAVDDVAFLAGSEPRAAVLAALSREGESTKDELVDRCDAARVTVARNLERLGERGLVAERDGRYRLTALGRLLAEEFLSLVDTAGVADDLAPLLEHVPASAFDLDPRALAGAEVTSSTATNPCAPAARHAESLRTAERVRQLLPAVSPQSIDASADRVLSGALEMEVVVDDAVATTLRTDLADRFEPLRQCEHQTSYVYDGEIPYFLGLVDGTVQIGVADEEGIPRALVESDDEAVRSWAEETYESYRAAAEPFGRRG